MSETSRPPSAPLRTGGAVASPAVRLWTGAVVVLALVLGLPGAFRNFRPPPGIPDPAAVVLPEPIEPAGELEDAPSVFRWNPGSDDVDFSQVVIYRSSVERIWASPPLSGSSYRVDPDRAFLGIPALEECGWRVREVRNGSPRATSRIVPFSFRRDHRGLQAGEAAPEARFLVE